MEDNVLNSITQAEFDKRFADYIKTQKFDGSDYERWWCNKLMKFAKDLEDSGTTISAGFYVNDKGERVNE